MPEILVDPHCGGVVEVLKPRNNTHGVAISINTAKNDREQMWFRHPANLATCNVDELKPALDRPAVYKFKNQKGSVMSRFTATVSRYHPQMSWLWRDIVLLWLWNSMEVVHNVDM